MHSFESINGLILPVQLECRLQELIRLHSEGKLSASERHELDLIMEAQQVLAAIRGKAQALLDAAAPISIHPAQTVRNGLPVMLVSAGTPAIDPDAVRRLLAEAVF